MIQCRQRVAHQVSQPKKHWCLSQGSEWVQSHSLKLTMHTLSKAQFPVSDFPLYLASSAQRAATEGGG